MNYKKIISYLQALCDNQEYIPFNNLLKNLMELFPDYDPVYVLINSDSLGYYKEESKNGVCVCGRRNLLHVYVAQFQNEEYHLGSQCIQSLQVLDMFKQESEMLDMIEHNEINSMKLFYKSMKNLHKKPCKTRACNKFVDLKKNWEKDEIFKLYCSTCIIDEDSVKCDICFEPCLFNSKRSICKPCDLKKRKKKYCDYQSCKAIIDDKYPFCPFHNKIKLNSYTKTCYYCQTPIKDGYNFCYKHKDFHN